MRKETAKVMDAKRHVSLFSHSTMVSFISSLLTQKRDCGHGVGDSYPPNTQKLDKTFPTRDDNICSVL